MDQTVEAKTYKCTTKINQNYGTPSMSSDVHLFNS